MAEQRKSDSEGDAGRASGQKSSPQRSEGQLAAAPSAGSTSEPSTSAAQPTTTQAATSKPGATKPTTSEPAATESAAEDAGDDNPDELREWVESKIDMKNPQNLKDVKQEMWNDSKSLRDPTTISAGITELKEYDRLVLELLGQEIESDERLSNLVMFRKAKDQLRLSNEGSLPPPMLGMKPIDEFMAQPPIDGRSFRYAYKKPEKCDACKDSKSTCNHQDPYGNRLLLSQTGKGKGWNCLIIDNADHPDPWLTTGKYDTITEQRKHTIASFFLDTKDFTEDHARRLFETMCRLAERWPVLDEITA